MFKQIPNDFLNLDFDWSQFKTKVIRSKFYSEKRGAGSFFYYMIQRDTLLKGLHKRNIFGIMPEVVNYVEFTGSGLVTPHRDQVDRVALNFYVKTNNDATILYDDNLKEIDRFVARTNDMFLLDVQQIHGVQKSTDEIRQIISYRWSRKSYAEILESLII